MAHTIEAVLDPRTVQQLQELGGESQPGLFRELLDLYRTDGRRRVRELHEALVRRDWSVLEFATHALKSGSVNIGADGVAELCHHLEIAIREGRETIARSLVHRIAEEFALVEALEV